MDRTVWHFGGWWHQGGTGPAGGAPLVLAMVPPPFLSLEDGWETLAPQALVESRGCPGTFGVMAEPIAVPLVDLDGIAEPIAYA